MFYQYGLVYMGARMLNNISASMLQFYLTYVLEVNGEVHADNPDKTSIYLAIFPLVCFISAVISSSSMNKVYRWIGRKKTFSIGVAF